MKKSITQIFLVATLLIISACGGATPSQNQSNGNPPAGALNQTGSTKNGATKDTTNYLNASYSNALSVPMQLIIGTLKLQDTDNEVDAETAKELLTLWKAVKALSNSDTTSSLEMEGLYKQIQRTMTKEQLTAISDMQLSMENMREISQELGLSMGGPGIGNMSEDQKATAQASRASGGSAAMGGGMMGGAPGGGIPGGMMGGPPGQDSSSDSEETSRPSQASEVDTNLIEALLEYLKSRIQ